MNYIVLQDLIVFLASFMSNLSIKYSKKSCKDPYSLIISISLFRFGQPWVMINELRLYKWIKKCYNLTELVV